MHKTLTTLFFILLFPILVFAQNDNVVKDFVEGATDLTSLQINDHLNVLQVTNDGNTFDLIGINDQMQVVWKTSLQGHPIKIAKFKNNIVAVASTDYSKMKLTNNTFNAFLVEPLSGKLLVQKQIYTGPDTYIEYPEVSTGDGDFLKFSVRQSAFERSIHFDIYGFDIKKFIKEINKTTDLETFEFNSKLEQIGSFKPQIAGGTYIKTIWNKYGDMFVTWLNGPTIEVFQYENGKTAPSNQLNVDVAFKEDDRLIPGNSIKFTPDENNRTALYCGLVYYNEDKEGTLGIGKFDFASGKKLFINELLTKAHLKDLTKSFVTVNKKIDDPKLMPFAIGVRYIKEINGKLITTLSSLDGQQSGINSGGAWMSETSTLINIYDTDLNLKFQNIMPGGYSYPNTMMQTSYKLIGNKLNVFCNYKSGTLTMNGLYGSLDVTTGGWDKITILSKKKLNNGAYANGSGLMWFGNSYIVPYCDPKTLKYYKFDISLQQNDY
jgi:hypothetical protein